MNLRQQLIDFESFKLEAYPDPLTRAAPWTIGVGHTGPEVRKGLVWTPEQVNAALDEDIAKASQGVFASLPWAQHMNEPRQAVVIGMAFQMGLRGLLGFMSALDSMRDERFANAAEGMRRSLWAKQTPKRALRLAHQMETGEWN